MINLGDKLYYTKDWYEILQSALSDIDKNNSISKIMLNKLDIHQAVLLDLDKFILNKDTSEYYKNYIEFHTNPCTQLLKLIQYYEEERNNRLNSILGKY